MSRNALLFLFGLCLSCSLLAASDEAPEEILVIGRQPGPPLWRVSNGDKVLWIFPYLSRIPQDMTWDSGRVARIIAGSQQFIDMPEAQWTPPASAMLNPFNVARSMRNASRTMRLPDGTTLDEVVPAPLYARFAALQARYFPGNREIVETRPLFAGRTMMNMILKREGLVEGDDILKELRRLVRRNGGIERTEIALKAELGDSFNEYETRLLAVYASFPPEQEQACFEAQVRRMEEDIIAMKRQANAWAQGYIDDFGVVSARVLTVGELEACDTLFTGSSSPEYAELEAMLERRSALWLDAVDKALATHASTFAVLPINDLLAEDGLLAQLRAKGYELREP